MLRLCSSILTLIFKRKNKGTLTYYVGDLNASKRAICYLNRPHYYHSLDFIKFSPWSDLLNLWNWIFWLAVLAVKHNNMLLSYYMQYQHWTHTCLGWVSRRSEAKSRSAFTRHTWQLSPSLLLFTSDSKFNLKPQ